MITLRWMAQTHRLHPGKILYRHRVRARHAVASLLALRLGVVKNHLPSRNTPVVITLVLDAFDTAPCQGTVSKIGNCLDVGRFNLPVSPGKLSCEKGVARHDPLHIVPRDVEVRDSIDPTKLYGCDIVGFSGFLLSA